MPDRAEEQGHDAFFVVATPSRGKRHALPLADEHRYRRSAATRWRMVPLPHLREIRRQRGPMPED